MAVRIQLAGTALSRVRFAISAVFETVMAVDVLRRPGAHAVHMPGLDTELRRVRATPTTQVRRDLDRRSGPLPQPLRELYGDPRAGLARVVAAVRACHQVLIGPHWPRIVRLLEADIGHRASALADGGIQAVFADLHRDVSWTDGELVLHPGHRPNQPVTVDLTGHGLVMSPSVFAWPRTWTDIRPAGTGIVRYPARGTATVWETHEPAPDALAALIGRTRAGLLELLAAPATTSDLQPSGQLAGGRWCGNHEADHFHPYGDYADARRTCVRA